MNELAKATLGLIHMGEVIMQDMRQGSLLHAVTRVADLMQGYHSQETHKECQEHGSDTLPSPLSDHRAKVCKFFVPRSSALRKPLQ